MIPSCPNCGLELPPGLAGSTVCPACGKPLVAEAIVAPRQPGELSAAPPAEDALGDALEEIATNPFANRQPGPWESHLQTDRKERLRFWGYFVAILLGCGLGIFLLLALIAFVFLSYMIRPLGR